MLRCIQIRNTKTSYHNLQSYKPYTNSQDAEQQPSRKARANLKCKVYKIVGKSKGRLNNEQKRNVPSRN